ncbi:MAG: helix-turn-helix domain-containing protein [Selenomonadales bacterium]|nr:helix-turn-helix domain-containing protein [Selenomonadales bacterium]
MSNLHATDTAVVTRVDALPSVQRSDWPLWLTVDEAAALLRVHVSTVYEMVSRKELPAKRIGRTIRIDRDALFL